MLIPDDKRLRHVVIIALPVKFRFSHDAESGTLCDLAGDPSGNQAHKYDDEETFGGQVSSLGPAGRKSVAEAAHASRNILGSQGNCAELLTFEYLHLSEQF
jgi:hypothetical protein